MTYTSREEWDTNISSVGGRKDVNLVISPWSDNASANSTQGILTNGVLINEFEPPKIMIEPATEGYFYQNRVDMGRMNNRATSLIQSEISSLNASAAGATSDTTAGTPTTPSTTDTTEATTASNTAESFRTKREPYVAPSRRTVKNPVKNSTKKLGRTSSTRPKVSEKYNPGIPGLVGSNIHQERFTIEESNNIIVILLSIIVFCMVGVCAGLIVPYVRVSKLIENRHN